MKIKTLVIGSSLLSGAVGSVAGYFFAKNTLKAKYEELASKEIAEAKDYYKVLYKRDENESPATVLQRRVPTRPEGVDDSVHQGPEVAVLEKVLDGLRYGTFGRGSKADINVNVFNGSGPDDEDHSEENAARSEDRPYILNAAEFLNDEVGYEQQTFTYFKADGILVDEEDAIVENVEYCVGEDNLLKFGHRSNDPNVVYIRNEKMNVDFEVCLSEGSYKEEVAGL